MAFVCTVQQSCPVLYNSADLAMFCSVHWPCRVPWPPSWRSGRSGVGLSRDLEMLAESDESKESKESKETRELKELKKRKRRRKTVVPRAAKTQSKISQRFQTRALKGSLSCGLDRDRERREQHEKRKTALTIIVAQATMMVTTSCPRCQWATLSTSYRAPTLWP